MLLARGLVAGLAITTAVLLKSDGMASGLATSFPAIFLTIQVGLWLSQAQAVQGGAVGPMILGGGSPSLFGMIFSLTVPTLGIILAGALSWCLAACVVSIPAFYFIQWRHSLNGTGLANEETRCVRVPAAHETPQLIEMGTRAGLFATPEEANDFTATLGRFHSGFLGSGHSLLALYSRDSGGGSGEKALGWVYFSPGGKGDPETFELLYLVVEKESQKNGIGKALLKEVENLVLREGGTWLEAAPQKSTAGFFLEKQGFLALDSRAGYKKSLKNHSAI